MNIIVTGASRGIGFDLVKAFAAMQDNKIIAIARSKDRLAKLAEITRSFPERGEVIPVAFDLSEISRIKEYLVPLVVKHMPGIDILVNNAGHLTRKPFQAVTRAEVEMNLTVNFLAPFFLIQGLMETFLRSDHPHVVNISSMGGFQGSIKFPGLSAYSASKAAIANLTECLASEFQETNITFNCLAIGSVQTEMLAEAFPGHNAPLSPPEMAEFIRDFAVKGHRFFNGKIIPVTSATP
jgi:NAD(P)-dependent dehydrogenase (short-subunit alcohol dehydrogenase family)